MQMYRGAVAQVFRRWMNAAHGPGQHAAALCPDESCITHDIWNEDWQVYEIDKPHFPAVGLEPYNRSGNAEPTRAT
jgi:hypothetical protein